MSYGLTEKQLKIAREFVQAKRLCMLGDKKLLGIYRIEIENSVDVVVQIIYNKGPREKYTLKNMINELKLYEQRESDEADKAWEYRSCR